MKNIIWVCSYPKSGNTMMRMFLSAYFFTKDGKINDFKVVKAIRKFSQKSVFDKLEKQYNINFLNNNPNKLSEDFILLQKKLYSNYPKNIFFFKTHNTFSNLDMMNFTDAYHSRSVIYIVRDPRSVLLSHLHHFNLKKQKKALDYIIGNFRYSAGDINTLPEIISSWNNHYISWKNFIEKNKVGRIIKFEDIISNPEKELSNIIEHLCVLLGQEVDEKKLKNSIESIEFSNLKQIEQRDGFDERTKNQKQFFRKGIIDEWKTSLEIPIKNQLETIFQKEMRELEYM